MTELLCEPRLFIGGVGLAAVQGAKRVGASTVIEIDRNTAKASLAAKLGANHVLVADENARKAVRKLTDGQGVGYAFDCVGLSRTIREACGMSRRGGNVCRVGIGVYTVSSAPLSCSTSPER